jgi:hypothetical protein
VKFELNIYFKKASFCRRARSFFVKLQLEGAIEERLAPPKLEPKPN